MKYRIGTFKDHADIEDTIASTGYYPPVDASLMDGTYVVAETPEGQIVGCIWVMHYRRNAYIDYLAIRPDWQHKGIGIKLLLRLRAILKRRGVRYVRAMVHLANEETLKISRVFSTATHMPYCLCFANIGD